jgi:hypothetical protein
MLRHRFQADMTGAIGHLSYITQSLVLVLGMKETTGIVSVQASYCLHEGLQGKSTHVRRKQWLYRHIRELKFTTREAGQDQCLSSHIKAAEVLSRVRLSESLAPRLIQSCGESYSVF